MKKLFLQLLFILCAINSIAQTDTIYLYAPGVPCEKNSARFYYLSPIEKVGELFSIKHYYLDGTLAFEGYSSQIPYEIYHGLTTSYYPSGNKKQEVDYKERKPGSKVLTFIENGTVVNYLENGKISTSGIYKDGCKFEGTFDNTNSFIGYEIDDLFHVFHPKYERYDSCKLMYCYSPYVDSEQMAFEVFYDYENKTTRSIYYHKDGTKIGESVFQGKSKVGIHVQFYLEDNREVAAIKRILNYKNDKLVGEIISYNKQGKLLGKGILKNERYFSGDFYDDRDLTLTHYENGIQNGPFIKYSQNGDVIAKGILKEGNRWEGQFIIDYPRHGSEIISYSQGEINGKHIYFYDEKFKNIHYYAHLVDGKKDGEYAYYNKEGKELAKGIYQEDEPFEGTFYDAKENSISTYEDGTLNGDFIQLDKNGEVFYTVNYRFGKREGWVKSINPFDKKIHECYFRNGIASSGEIFLDDENTLHILEQGALSEIHYYRLGYDPETYHEYPDNDTYDFSTPFKIEKFKDQKIIAVTQKKNGKQYHLTLKNEEPFDGVEFSYNGMHTYKNGKKHGSFDTYHQKGQYVQGSVDGKITFYNSNDSTFCIYKNGAPIDGTVWSYSDKTNYKNGKKHGTETKSVSFGQLVDQITQTYKNGILDGEVIYKKEELVIEKGVYKNNQPYEGIFFEENERYKVARGYYSKETTYIVTPYKKGKKEGEQNIYNKNKTLLESHEYKNNNLITSSVFNIGMPDEGIFKGTYKKGKPNEGEFVQSNKDEIRIRVFKRGETQKVVSISSFGRDTLFFKNEKPFEGKKNEIIDEELFQHHYQQGIHTKTTFDNYVVNYFSNGFETKENCENCWSHKVEFSDKNKTSGKVTFGKEIDDNFIRFTDGEIVEIHYNQNVYDKETINWEVKKNSQIVIRFSFPYQKVIYEIVSDFKLNLDKAHFELIRFPERIHENSNVFYYLTNEEKPFASLEIIDGRNMNGFELEPGRDGLYHLELEKNGKNILEYELITLERVLEICKENQ